KSSTLNDELSRLIDFWALSDSVFTATGKSVPTGKGLVSPILLNIRPRSSFKDSSTSAHSSSPAPAQLASPSDQSSADTDGDPFTISPATEDAKESKGQADPKDENLTGGLSDGKAQRLGEEGGQDKADKLGHSKSEGPSENSDQEWAERKSSGHTESLGENGGPGRQRGKYRIEGQGSDKPKSSGENGSKEQALSQDADAAADEASDTDKYMPKSNANFYQDEERFMLEGQPGEAGASSR
ncbi:hypothetical protein IJT17_09690, partial [bacterium]|nr:hypothetical protein [bacterium]